ncbi:MAG: DNA mismatch repair endonuclease MutL [Candidatus Sericytochromatia bacterium]|nr:DNA mismatch repair endonuclease MutL [Candidatus Sericytochromatia bacterium]
MGIIHLLSDHVANQIAAGEVVERPASVVKELAENAIDAGARRLRIVVDQGGREITVTDDGIGMTPEDARLAFARFATSKLTAADDLWALQTLGFRGEALASIAAVAEVTCVTRQADVPLATRLHWRGGDLLDAGETGGAVGTTFQVKDLFFNTPARLRFMRAPGTEVSAITELVSALALAYPQVAVTLSHGSREVLRTPGDGDAAMAVRAVLGRDIADHLFTIEGDNGGARISGFATRASYHRADRAKQFLFVNGRWVKLPFVSKLLDEFYSDLLPARRYPASVLTLTVDPATLDVNVHPTKREVRLREAQSVRNLLAMALGGAISLQAGHRTMESHVPAPLPHLPIVPIAEPDDGTPAPTPEPHAAVRPWQSPVPTPSEARPAGRPYSPMAPVRPTVAQTQAALSFYKPLPEAAVISLDAVATERHDPVQEVDHHGPIPLATAQGRRFANLTALGQMYRTYIVAAGPEGLFLIDQHTAHERVLFEKLSRDAVIQSQMLLVPLAVDADAAAIELVAAHQGLLSSFGFEFDRLGGAGLAITAVPQLLSLSQAEAAWTDLIDDLHSFDGIAERGARLAAIRKTVACKAAVKAGDSLALPQMQELLQQLICVEQPYTCPHGRPVVSVLPKDELDRRFGRTWSIKDES